MANAIIRRQMRKVAAAMAVAETKKQAEKLTVVEEIKSEIVAEAPISTETIIETPVEEQAKPVAKKKKTTTTLTE